MLVISITPSPIGQPLTRTLSPTLYFFTDSSFGIRRRNMPDVVFTIKVGSATSVLMPVTTPFSSSGGVGDAAGRAISGGTGLGRAAGGAPSGRPESLAARQAADGPVRAFRYSWSAAMPGQSCQSAM